MDKKKHSYWSHGPVEKVDLPMKNGGIVHRFLYVYQRLMVFRPNHIMWVKLAAINAPSSSHQTEFVGVTLPFPEKKGKNHMVFIHTGWYWLKILFNRSPIFGIHIQVAGFFFLYPLW